MKEGIVLVQTGFVPSCVNCGSFVSCRQGHPKSPHFPATWTFPEKIKVAPFPEGDLVLGLVVGPPVKNLFGEGCSCYRPRPECAMPLMAKHRDYADLEKKRVDLETRAGHRDEKAGRDWVDTVGQQARLQTLPRGMEKCEES